MITAKFMRQSQESGLKTSDFCSTLTTSQLKEFCGELEVYIYALKAKYLIYKRINLFLLVALLTSVIFFQFNMNLFTFLAVFYSSIALTILFIMFRKKWHLIRKLKIEKKLVEKAWLGEYRTDIDDSEFLLDSNYLITKKKIKNMF